MRTLVRSIIAAVLALVLVVAATLVLFSMQQSVIQQPVSSKSNSSIGTGEKQSGSLIEKVKVAPKVSAAQPRCIVGSNITLVSIAGVPALFVTPGCEHVMSKLKIVKVTVVENSTGMLVYEKNLDLVVNRAGLVPLSGILPSRLAPGVYKVCVILSNGKQLCTSMLIMTLT